MDLLQPSSLNSDRSGLSRTGSGMAGSFKGGLSTLLASPSPSPSFCLQRSSFSSDQCSLNAFFSADLSSSESSGHCRSYQALSSLSVSLRPKEKSPAMAARHMMGSPVFSPLHGSLTHQPSSQAITVGSLPSKPPVRAIGHQQPATRAFGFLSSTPPAMHVYSGRATVVVNSLASKAKPSAPADVQEPICNIGFALPPRKPSPVFDANPITSTIVADSLDHGASRVGSELSEKIALEASSETDDGFMTPVCSFNAIPGDDDDADFPIFEWEPPAFEQPLSSYVGPSSTAFPDAVKPSPYLEGRADKLSSRLLPDRERILRYVEAANGLRRDSQDSLLVAAQKEFPVFEKELVKRAFEFASTAHMGQVRKNGEPVLVHCVETAKILAGIGADSTIVAAGLLHDCLDDTPMTADQLEASFGPSIMGLVRGVSNLSSISQRTRDLEGALSAAEFARSAESGKALTEAQLDLLRTMLLSLEDVRTVLIKLADRLHNLRTLAGLPDEKRRRMASETLEVFAPLANRLGIWSWKAEIEDICFRTLWPEEYGELQASVEGSHGDVPVLRAIAQLDKGLREAGVGFVDLHGRSKNLFSIFNKMQSKGKSLSQVFDRRGLRLIVGDKRSCYEALKVVRKVWPRELTGHFKDYVANPKGNGYQSLHVVLEDEDGHPLEVQIRTEEMHREAEFGVAAHWRYKERRKPVPCAHSSGTNNSCCTEDGVSEDDEQFAMRRVEWARYVLSWVAEVDDMKLRLSSTGSVVTGSAGSESKVCGSGQLCPFPEHREDCCFHPRVLFAGPTPTPPRPETEPVLVLVVDKASVAVTKVEGSGTRESFVRSFLEDRGKLHLLSQASLLVNSELTQIDGARFHMGDQVEVVLDSPRTGGCPPPEPNVTPEEELLFDGFEGETWAHEAAMEGDLLPGYAVDVCPLALEFQRRKLAVNFGSAESRRLEKDPAL